MSTNKRVNAVSLGTMFGGINKASASRAMMTDMIKTRDAMAAAAAAKNKAPIRKVTASIGLEFGPSELGTLIADLTPLARETDATKVNLCIRISFPRTVSHDKEMSLEECRVEVAAMLHYLMEEEEAIITYAADSQQAEADVKGEASTAVAPSAQKEKETTEHDLFHMNVVWAYDTFTAWATSMEQRKK
jgi:hypothetical protein